MKGTLRLLLGLAVSLMLAWVGFAQQSASDQPASKEDVEKYMEVAHSRKMIDDMMAAMTKQMHEMVHQQLSKIPSLPPGTEEQEIKMIDGILKDFEWDEMLQAMVPIYQKHFTKGDIEALTAFYGAPTGQKVLGEMPAIMAETMQAMTPMIQNMAAKAAEQAQAAIAELQKQNQAKLKKQPVQN